MEREVILHPPLYLRGGHAGYLWSSSVVPVGMLSISFLKMCTANEEQKGARNLTETASGLYSAYQQVMNGKDKSS